MKKLLLVLAVVAMASFLLVGCIPGLTPDPDPDPDPDPGPVEATMTWGSEYTNPAGETFIRCFDDIITVTTPTPVETDYVVYVAVKDYFGVKVSIPNGDDPEGEQYTCMVALEPDVTRTIWTLDYTEATGDKPDFICKGSCCEPLEGECEPMCVVALLKHPCCPGEEIALRVVSADCTPPTADLFVTFYDCIDECDPEECAVPGAYATWTSRTTGDCETTDCCEDDCSGVAGWTLVVEPDPCAEPCNQLDGGCPIDDTLPCGCLVYPDTGTKDVVVAWSLVDNVGNEEEGTVTIELDTDEVTKVDDYEVEMGVEFPMAYGNCDEEEVPNNILD